LSQRHIVPAFLKGAAITPLGGLIGSLIALLAFGSGISLGDLVFLLAFGTAIGSLFAAPATMGLFPVLYAIWPTRTMRAFICVLPLSALGGFLSPFAYMGETDLRSMILEPMHTVVGMIGMVSAMILTPLYFRWTRRPATAGEPQ
jgi:hypothetical protein